MVKTKYKNEKFDESSSLFLGETHYVRGCINQIEAVRPDMPTVRENGCWTATDNYVVRHFSSSMID